MIIFYYFNDSSVFLFAVVFGFSFALILTFKVVLIFFDNNMFFFYKIAHGVAF